MIDLIETTPQMDLATQDIEHLVEELRGYHAIYSPLFQRRAQREAAPTSLQGLLATLPRKSIEPMVLMVDGAASKAVRAMQSFISEGQWNDERLLHQHWKEIVLTEAEGYSFETGKADITPEFSEALTTKIISDLNAFAEKYNCDVIEVIGHTDGQPVASKSNLDEHLSQALRETVPLTPGSNADLGLMRAWSVIRYLREIKEFQGKVFYGYSAGQAILPDGSYAALFKTAPDPTRRRIEIRLRRSPSLLSSEKATPKL